MADLPCITTGQQLLAAFAHLRTHNPSGHLRVAPGAPTIAATLRVDRRVFARVTDDAIAQCVEAGRLSQHPTLGRLASSGPYYLTTDLEHARGE